MYAPDIGRFRRLRFKHLELFRAVLDKQTLLGAAKATHMTQPAATKLIQELEDIFGVQLFERGKHGMRPTHFGHVAYRHITVLFADLAHMAGEIELISEGNEGHIRLGLLPSLAPDLVTSSVIRMLKEHPKVRLTLQEGTTTELLAGLSNNELDITFARILDHDLADRYRISRIYEEPFVIVVRRSHPLSRQPSVDWRTLARATWILPTSGTPIRNFVDNLFISAGALRPQAAIECITLEKIRHLVQGSDMVGILPKSFVAPGASGGSLSIIEKDMSPCFTPISLVARNQDHPPPAILKLERIIYGVASEMGLQQ